VPLASSRVSRLRNSVVLVICPTNLREAPMFGRLRKLFSHRSDRDFDVDRARDSYMDTLRELQKPPKPRPNPVRQALDRVTSARARRTENVPE
jgi:hypothetical protein